MNTVDTTCAISIPQLKYFKRPTTTVFVGSKTRPCLLVYKRPHLQSISQSKATLIRQTNVRDCASEPGYHFLHNKNFVQAAFADEEILQTAIECQRGQSTYVNRRATLNLMLMHPRRDETS
jgi:hypothetical protein